VERSEPHRSHLDYQLLKTQAIDEATAQLLSVAMEELTGVLGIVGKQGESVSGPTH